MPNRDTQALDILKDVSSINKLKEKIENIDYVINNLKLEKEKLQKELDVKIKDTIRETYNWK